MSLTVKKVASWLEATPMRAAKKVEIGERRSVAEWLNIPNKSISGLIARTRVVLRCKVSKASVVI